MASDGPSPLKRLGIRALGIHAHEKRMPKRLLAILSRDATVQHATPDLIPLLGQLLERTTRADKVYLCHPCVWYVGNIKDGLRGDAYQFCGYQNIQMLMSYLHRGSSTHPALKSGIPSILRLQEMIEEAWDAGINAHGRVQTGGIRGTRKHIGTLEAQALFKHMDIKTEVRAFREPATASDQLIAYVKEHFASAPVDLVEKTNVHKVVQTKMPPIYLQRKGHSVTIIGIETYSSDLGSLLVFDPAKSLGQDLDKINTKAVDVAVRHSQDDIRRYRAFELLHFSREWALRSK